MAKTFYTRYIKPVSTEPEQAEREIVLNYILVGMIGLTLAALADTILVFLLTFEHYLLFRMLIIVATLAGLIGLHAIARYKQFVKFAALATTLLVAAASCAMAYRWGLLIPTGLLFFSLAVVMAGILIGARYSIFMALAIAAVLTVLQIGENSNTLHPDLSWVGTKPTVGDVIGFSAILCVIALVSWLFNRQMELSLKRALKSEAALQHQKDILEMKVEQRAKQLEASQLEKMQEIYRFAELGRLSTGLFHDLANHLSSVSVDIEGLSSKDQSAIMQRISQNIGNIDTIVRRVRQQIRGKTTIEVFPIVKEIEEVIAILEPTARQSHVAISLVSDASVKTDLSYKGDVIRFRQVILNLMSNAIEAYPAKQATAPQRQIEIVLHRYKTALAVAVTDYGDPIPKRDQEKIFNPFFTTKAEGAGIGLFLVKQIVEQDFSGTVTLESSKARTTFTVNLPKTYYASKAKN